MNFDGLPGSGMAGDDCEVGGGDLEDFREELEDGIVGAAIFGGLGDFDLEGVAILAGELGAAGVGDDFDVEEEGFGFLGEHGRRVS